MSKPLTIEEILAHPAFPTVLEFHTPDRQGNAPVAIDRAGGPMAIAYEVHGTGPVHLVVHPRNYCHFYVIAGMISGLCPRLSCRLSLIGVL